MKFRKKPVVIEAMQLTREVAEAYLWDGGELPPGAKPDVFAATYEPAVKERPHTVCLCGSSRFREAHERATMSLTLAGHIVVGMGLFGHDDHPPGAKAITSDGDESTEVKRALDELHLRKIDLADEVLILNVGGYIGSSTQRELAYAVERGKRVRFWERSCDGHEPWHCDEGCERAELEAALWPVEHPAAPVELAAAKEPTP